MPSNDIDPRLIARLATNRTSRRRFIGGGTAAAAAVALGGSFLAACSSDNKSATGTTSTQAGPASGLLRISNWPLYMADGFVADFQKATGITVDYKEDINDNEQWFAKVKEPLSRKQDIGADLAVPTTFMAVRLHGLGWLNDISDEGVPNKGQIRRFTGNDYADDLATGNVAIAQAYSGDVVQLQADNPDLHFVVPESGGTTFVDTMVIPYTTQNQKAAEVWINYVYERPNYAKLVAHTQYVPVLSDMTGELDKINPKLSSNPLINPPKETLAKLKGWPALTDEQTRQYNDAYAAVSGG